MLTLVLSTLFTFTFCLLSLIFDLSSDLLLLSFTLVFYQTKLMFSKPKISQSMKNILIIFLLFINCSIYSQENLTKLYNQYLSAKNTGTYFTENPRGTPYENPEFMEARVYFKGEEEPLPGKMRYNSYEDEMEFIRNMNDQVLVLTNRNKIDSIRLENKTYQYLKVIEDQTVNSGYFVKLSTGECSLYKKSSKRFQEEKPPQSGYEDYVPPSFIQEEDGFYLSFDNAPLIKIPERKKKIQELLSEHGYENREMSKMKYKEEDLVEYFGGLERVKE